MCSLIQTKPVADSTVQSVQSNTVSIVPNAETSGNMVYMSVDEYGLQDKNESLMRVPGKELSIEPLPIPWPSPSKIPSRSKLHEGAVVAVVVAGVILLQTMRNIGTEMKLLNF